MYRRFSRFMSYRRFYVWRARYNYLVRNCNEWTFVYVLLFLGLLYSCWIIWKISNPPVPRVHPQAAKVQLRMMGEQATHRVAVAYDGGGAPGVDVSVAAEVRAAAQRSARVRGTYLSEESLQLQAHMLADISDYITVSGVCAPYVCWHVSETITRLRRASQRTAALNEALQPMLGLADGALPPLEGELERLQTSWSDNFQDVTFHGWALHDIQVMHEQMMRQYPERAPMPWYSRLTDKPADPFYGL
ncbi:hypothetical protein [Stenotrophomonas sp.]|uniref:hypothetical protein n=1 Tax=Stenotrophomonas sp. TaxID=69392 RepID=UPI002D608082|nr:hypothetical protein [Stenotrophomonas sp.]HYQ25266.1 hypothetical protein [Stenotrophomonas sp.]